MMYCCPRHPAVQLLVTPGGLICTEGHEFVAEQIARFYVPRFEVLESQEVMNNEQLYAGDDIDDRYRNFLNWLFSTFQTSQREFRASNFASLPLSRGSKILVTGCGHGDDLEALATTFPNLNLELHGQDILHSMIRYTAERLAHHVSVRELNVSSAAHLPYPSNSFDVVFHFGGINYFGERVQAIKEMSRVSKEGGRVVFIDESVAPWLRSLDYGKMMMANNPLWGALPPIDELPQSARDVSLTWLLENCFYMISFTKDSSFPNVNLDVEHIGRRGGTIRSRYRGQMEGIEPELRDRFREWALSMGVSESRLLERVVRMAIEETSGKQER